MVWGEYMVVYGGYQLASGQQPEGEFPQLLWYHFPSQTWQVSSLGLDGADFPELRHSHSAVLCNVSFSANSGSFPSLPPSLPPSLSHFSLFLLFRFIPPLPSPGYHVCVWWL